MTAHEKDAPGAHDDDAHGHEHGPGHSHGQGHSHGHGHGHGHAHGASALQQSRRRLAVVLGLTASFALAEVVGGWLTGSLALLADAGHMATDSLGILLALLAARVAARPATERHTFGFHRAEVLAAAANGLLLLGLCIFVLVEAYRRLRTPHPVHTGPMLVIAALGLVVNVVGLLLLSGGAKGSLNLRAAYMELLADALSSVGVFVAAAVMWLTGYAGLDPLVSAGIGLFMLPRTWKLLREVGSVLLEGAPADVDVGALRTALGRVAGVSALHDLHVWTLTSGRHSLSVHVVLAAGAQPDDVIEAVRERAVHDFGIKHVTVQPETRCCALDATHP